LEIGTYKAGAVVYWTSNNEPVPPWCFEDAGLPVPPGQKEARQLHVEAAKKAH
jgi:hypothetical protein